MWITRVRLGDGAMGTPPAGPGWHLVRRLTIPPRSPLLDTGLEWVRPLERPEFDGRSLAVYDLVERDAAC